MADHSGALGAHYRPQVQVQPKVIQVLMGLLKLPYTAAKNLLEAARSGSALTIEITQAIGDAYRLAKIKPSASSAPQPAFVYQPSEREPVMSRARTKAKEAAMSNINNGGGSNKKPVKKPLKKLVKKPVVKPAKKKVATTRARK